ncbi:MAG TPA: sugar nucleotide-binding protein, partial [Alphaproteobacteria bacterium]|nr:sugar nucleotide-binding protein [Alphaproteobacteria bacterium]
CAADPAGSAFINVTQTLTLAGRLAERDISTLFLSTNQVFDGQAPHMPADAPRAPVSEYGRQKAKAEAGLERLMEAGAPVAVLRLSKIVSPAMALVCGWVRALKSGEPIRPFTDMALAPVETRLTVQAIAALMRARVPGIFQLTGPTDVTYEAAARYIAGSIGADTALIEPVPAASAGMPPGATPRHTTLDCRALADRFGIVAPGPWAVIDRIVANAEPVN